MPPKKDNEGKDETSSFTKEFLKRAAKDEKLQAILDVMDD